VSSPWRGKIGGDGGLGSGEVWQRHNHWRGPKAEREGVLVVRSKGRTEERKMGHGGVGLHPI
jgi:hypothetical protein